MKTQNHFAFKEWATIVHALASGKQILILRKGGIREETGQFQMEQDEFFLFPTYEHQNKEDLKPEIHGDLESVIQSKPAGNTLPIQYYAQVIETIQIADEGELDRIRPYHVWSDQAVRKRFHYGQKKGLYAIIVRVFHLPSAHTIGVTSEYAGCKSWVELKETLSTTGAQPALSNSAFQKQLEAINTSLVKS